MEPGVEISGYLFENKVGEGGVAEVWQVKLMTTADVLAAKVLRPEFCANPRVRVRFEREGHIQLVHPNIVPVLQLEVFEDRPGLVMPLYRGGSLEKRIRPTALQQETNIGKPLPSKDVFAISREILGALNFANENQIIHRDVKPDNILFDELGPAKR
jgi:serine/threonine protein kinase